MKSVIPKRLTEYFQSVKEVYYKKSGMYAYPSDLERLHEDDFWVDEEIKNFCKIAYDAGCAQLQSDMDKTIEQNLALKKEVERLSIKCEDYREAMKDYITRFKNYVKAFFE